MSNSIYTSPLCSCIECKQPFSSKSIHTHYIRKHTDKSIRNTGKGTTKFLLQCSCIICKKEIAAQGLSQHIESHYKIKPTKQCPRCNELHTKDGTYCSQSCANKKTPSIGTRAKISNGVKSSQKYKDNDQIKNPPYTKIGFCSVCSQLFVRKGNTKTCSTECHHIGRRNGGIKGGKASAAKMVKRSVDEIALYELCAKHYTTVEHNVPMFNGWDADIIIHDTKTAILWNGPWHYRETGLSNHSLKQVQNRDRIKCDIITKMGWNVLIFEDRYYTPESAFLSIIS